VTEAPGRRAGAATGSRGAAFLLYWLPALAYIALIFTASSIRGENLPHAIPNLDKVAHLLEY
jgi:hypothetical protein